MVCERSKEPTNQLVRPVDMFIEVDVWFPVPKSKITCCRNVVGAAPTKAKSAQATEVPVTALAQSVWLHTCGVFGIPHSFCHDATAQATLDGLDHPPAVVLYMS